MPKTMQAFNPVESSMLVRVEYDAETSTLVAAFKNGTAYAYNAVPATEYAALVAVEAAGESVGSHFIRNIKNGGYTFKKVGA